MLKKQIRIDGFGTYDEKRLPVKKKMWRNNVVYLRQIKC
jgi:hypothetical protein